MRSEYDIRKLIAVFEKRIEAASRQPFDKYAAGFREAAVISLTWVLNDRATAETPSGEYCECGHLKFDHAGGDPRPVVGLSLFLLSMRLFPAASL